MKCTIQDIAKELNLSRNTVAKVLSHKQGVSDQTRRIVLEKAKEMNYRLEITESNNRNTQKKDPDTLLFLTRGSVNYTGFWLSVMKGIETVIKDKNYTLSMAMMDDEDIKSLNFPSSIYNPSVKGLILVELCDIAVCNAILELGLPTISIDMPMEGMSLLEKMDVVTMENKTNVQKFAEKLIENGMHSFAFAGDISAFNVGRGFKERYDALVETLGQHGLKLNRSASFLHESDQQLMNINYIVSALKKLDRLPDVYFCGNDWTAIQMMQAIQFMGYSVPKDISIIGFDNVIESEHSLPPLTTISTPKEILGEAAANSLIQRIERPETPHVYMQYMTTPIVRSSAAL